MDRWAEHVRDFCGGLCARCGHAHPGKLQAAHIIHRARSNNTRWHPRGGLPLCDKFACGCHYWYDEQASDFDRAELVIRCLGRETYDELHRIKNEPWDRDMAKIIEGVRSMAGFRITPAL